MFCKKLTSFFLLLILSTILFSLDKKMDQTIKINLKINNRVFEAELINNPTSKNIIKLLPLTLDMKDLNNNEKYYYLDEKLPVNIEVIENINAGDIMVYGDNCLVLFYKTFKTTYKYTRIGRIINIDKLLEVVGSETIKVTFYK
jgi:hypothetical protein